MFTDSDVALTVSDLKVRIKSMQQYSNERELNIVREECVECVKACRDRFGEENFGECSVIDSERDQE